MNQQISKQRGEVRIVCGRLALDCVTAIRVEWVAGITGICATLCPPLWEMMLWCLGPVGRRRML